MPSVPEALLLILERARPLSPVTVVLRDAHRRILAEEIVSDVDSPPHDKSMVDGYAVQLADFTGSPAESTMLKIIEEIMAGDVPHHKLTLGTTSRIMTGAPIPDGADAVVMVEKTETFGDQVRILEPPNRSGQNILRRATSIRRGDVVLKSSAEVRPCEIGLLAEVGRSQVLVVPRVKVAVLSTGNELVPCDQVPGPGQIRNSNGPLLLAAVERTNATPVELGIARDEKEDLQRLISLGLQSADILVLSGGVSAGDLDLAPDVLKQLNVVEVFHKVKLKPGKPIWFGTRLCEPPSNREQLVFGLPGNPVSSLVCFELFVRPAIEQMSGKVSSQTPSFGATTVSAQLTAPFQHRGDRPTFHPAQLELHHEPFGQGANLVTPLRWHGSADLRTLTSANALVCFPSGDRDYCIGEIVEVRPLR